MHEISQNKNVETSQHTHIYTNKKKRQQHIGELIEKKSSIFLPKIEFMKNKNTAEEIFMPSSGHSEHFGLAHTCECVCVCVNSQTEKEIHRNGILSEMLCRIPNAQKIYRLHTWDLFVDRLIA